MCPPGRNRVPRRLVVCDGCRSWLSAMLIELPGYVDELLVRQLDPDTAPYRGRTAKDQVSRDPVADLIPAASVASKVKAPRVSGSREQPAPLSLNAVDLTLPARYGTVRDEFGDQIGEHAVLTILDTWVREIRAHRHRGEGLPSLTVDRLAGWLTVRLDDICDDFEPVVDLAADVKHLRGALRAQLGLAGPDIDIKEGITCPKCDRQELYRRAGGKHVECGNCPVLLTLDEFERWTKVSAADLIHLRSVVCEDCGRNQIYRLKGTAMTRCGWCEWHILLKEEAV